MMGKAMLKTFTPDDRWFRYIASAQNFIGNGKYNIDASVIIDDGQNLYYGRINGGKTDTSDLTVVWSALGGNSYCGATIYSSSEPLILTKNMVWIG